MSVSLEQYYCTSCRKVIAGKPAIGAGGVPVCRICETPAVDIKTTKYYCKSCNKVIAGKPAIGAGGVLACRICLTPISDKPDMINHPPYYTYGPIEVIDIIEGFDLKFHIAQVVKYVLRAGRKDDELQDLKKARFYLDRYIKILEGNV